MSNADLSKVSAYADNEMETAERQKFEEELHLTPELQLELKKILLIKHLLQNRLHLPHTPDRVKAQIGKKLMKESGCDFGLGHSVPTPDILRSLFRRIK